MTPVWIHETADVSPEATIGESTRIWHHVQVREGVRIGRNCIVGKGVYIDHQVRVGNNCKIQNGCSVYHGARLEDGVFLGPGVILTNDRRPRAVNVDGTLKGGADWAVGEILVKRGAALGARSVVLPDVTIGTFAMVGAGSVVTRDVPDYGLVWGSPARLRGFVCPCGARLREGGASSSAELVSVVCPDCGWETEVPASQYSQVEEGA